MNLLDLKPLTPEYLPAVLELDRQCFGGLWTAEGYERELASPNSDLLVLSTPATPTASSTDSLPETLIGLGCLWSILEEAHITLLAIHPRYQRQGLGQLLLYALLTSARKRGLERATLEVRVSNHTALSLYQKFGFREVGKRRRYYQDTGEDALVLWLGGIHRPEFEQNLAGWHQQIQKRLAQQDWCWLAAQKRLSV